MDASGGSLGFDIPENGSCNQRAKCHVPRSVGCVFLRGLAVSLVAVGLISRLDQRFHGLSLVTGHAEANSPVGILELLLPWAMLSSGAWGGNHLER
jgi:hypothetical protein